jgi:hypothetical protein
VIRVCARPIPRTLNAVHRVALDVSGEIHDQNPRQDLSWQEALNRMPRDLLDDSQPDPSDDPF